MMKKLLLAVATLAAVAGPAFAQAKRDADPLEIIDREKKRQAEDNDRQYQRMMERTRKTGDTASTRSDPWANMRAPSDGKR
jgi:Ni/Co efflux regulator RcnB